MLATDEGFLRDDYQVVLERRYLFMRSFNLSSLPGGFDLERIMSSRPTLE